MYYERGTPQYEDLLEIAKEDGLSDQLGTDPSGEEVERSLRSLYTLEELELRVIRSGNEHGYPRSSRK